jgi:MFS family permease
MVDPMDPSGSESPKPTRLLLIAVSVLFVQQTFISLSRLILPVLAPVISEELAINPALVGAYSGILSSAAMVLAMGAGGFIERFGGWRMCQIALLATGVAMFMAAPGVLILFAVSAVLIGPGPGVSTPASSHVLSRHCPPKRAPFFFSIKQTGVPAGGLLAGLLVPFLAMQFGWRGAFLATGVLYVFLALLLQPFRAQFDDDRHAGRRSFLADARATLRAATADSRMRHLVMAAFAFVGLQGLFDSFFVTYLVNGLGHSLTTAGTVFSVAQGVAVVTRILWGAIAGAWASPRVVLAGLGLVMAGAAAAMGLMASAWSVTAIMAVAVVYTATAFSWHGVLLAEVARLAPAGRVGATTGGVMVFIMASATLYPLVFAGILAISGSFGVGYLVAAIPALIVGLGLLRRTEGKPSDGG